MQHNHVKIAVFIGLCLLCAGVYARALPRRAPESNSSSPSHANQLVSQVEAGSARTSAQRGAHARQAQRERMAATSWARDPFAEGAAGVLALTGILWDPAKPLAIINGNTVGIGDSLEGFQVTSILQNRVTVTDGNGTLELQVNP